MSTVSRAIYTINPEVLNRFNAAFKPRERSKVVERLIRQELDKHERALAEAARRIETDPRFASILEVSEDVDRVAGEIL
jgi:transcription initiation factor TFIIIB Brf1 subunit/transcription initiation factor TFIIB